MRTIHTFALLIGITLLANQSQLQAWSFQDVVHPFTSLYRRLSNGISYYCTNFMYHICMNYACNVIIANAQQPHDISTINHYLQIIKNIEPKVITELLKTSQRYKCSPIIICEGNLSHQYQAFCGITKEKYIYFKMSPAIYTLSYDEQQFIVAHEIGHFILGHHNAPSKTQTTHSALAKMDLKSPVKTQSEIKEFEADAYAAQKVSSAAAITFLKRIQATDEKNNTHLSSSQCSHPSLAERIAALEGQIKPHHQPSRL